MLTAIEVPVPLTEAARLDALRAFAVLDTLPEAVYDDITYLASQICDAPIALVSLIDGHRQWFKSRVGLDATETPRDQAFCAYAIMDPTELMVVPDAHVDERFCDNPNVTGAPYIRFYAGAPLVTADGHGLGTLCVIDRVPRTLGHREANALRALSRQVISCLEYRRAVGTIARHALEREAYQEQLLAYQRELEAANANLLAQTVTDSLSGLTNRAAFMRALDTEMDRATRYGAPLSLLLLDIDNFKAYNDAYGHVEGDVVIRQVARVLSEESRTSDVVGRIGGEEFGIILPSTTAASAAVLGERFRRAVEAATWPRRPVTISVGLGTLTGAVATRSAFLTCTDQALYASKAGGRNRVSVSCPQG